MMSPPVSTVPCPMLKTIFPVRPVTALPVDIFTRPELPLLVVPVLKTMEPLTPVVPASEVLIRTLPLDDIVPCPVDKEIDPPVPPLPRPASNFT